jgi:hypothetical protein
LHTAWPPATHNAARCALAVRLLCWREMEKVNLNDVLRLARMSEDELSTLIAQLDYYPADAPTRSPLPRDLMLLDIAINLRAISLKGGPVSAEPQWLELANRPELSEPANLVNDISASSTTLGLRVRR